MSFLNDFNSDSDSEEEKDKVKIIVSKKHVCMQKEENEELYTALTAESFETSSSKADITDEKTAVEKSIDKVEDVIVRNILARKHKAILK